MAGNEIPSCHNGGGGIAMATKSNREVSHLSPSVQVGNFEVAVFWDYENVQIPVWCSGVKASDAIRSKVIPLGRIVDRKLYYDLGKHFDHTNFASSELDSSGFTLVDCPSRNSKETLDKKLIVDALFFAWERASRGAKTCVVLITSDGDYSYTLARLRDIGVFTVIIFRPDVVANILTDNADLVMSWEDDVLGGNKEVTTLPRSQESSWSNVLGGNKEVTTLPGSQESSGSNVAKPLQEDNVEATIFDILSVFLKSVLDEQHARALQQGGSLHETWGFEGQVALVFYKKNGSHNKEDYHNMRRKALQRNLVEVGRRLLGGRERVVKCDYGNSIQSGLSTETYVRLTPNGLQLIRTSPEQNHSTVIVAG